MASPPPPPSLQMPHETINGLRRLSTRRSSGEMLTSVDELAAQSTASVEQANNGVLPGANDGVAGPFGARESPVGQRASPVDMGPVQQRPILRSRRRTSMISHGTTRQGSLVGIGATQLQEGGMKGAGRAPTPDSPSSVHAHSLRNLSSVQLLVKRWWRSVIGGGSGVLGTLSFSGNRTHLDSRTMPLPCRLWPASPAQVSFCFRDDRMSV